MFLGNNILVSKKAQKSLSLWRILWITETRTTIRTITTKTTTRTKTKTIRTTTRTKTIRITTETITETISNRFNKKEVVA